MFGNTQSRCHIFWLVHLLSFVFTKVSNLLATPSQDATSFGWSIHSFVFTKVSHLLATPSQDATSFGWSIHSHLCSPRCLTFWKHPVEMPHLLAGPSTLICVHQGVSPFGNTKSRCHIFGWSIHFICVHQGVPPFGNTQSRCHIVWLVHPSSLLLCLPKFCKKYS